MPFIRTITNAEISEVSGQALKEKLGKAIELIPGKTEHWLMLQFADRQQMYFQGDNAPTAMVEVSIYGAASSEAYDALTGAVTDILHQELGICRDRIYVAYREVEHWGFDGSNF